MTASSAIRRVGARRVIVGLVLAVLTVSAGQDVGATPPAKRRTHTVVMEATQYQPATITVKAGDTIEWVNKDLFPHTASSAEAKFNSEAIAAGATWKFTPKVKGDFSYTCIFHPTMKGQLRVQ